MTTSQPSCFCNSGDSFKNCCQPYLSGALLPKTPEQLMRSRYSAFCTKNIDYLMSTYHVTNQVPGSRMQLEKSIATTQWLGLKVIKSNIDKSDKTKGQVEFIAFYQGETAGQLHEQSEFIYEDGKWFYLGGQMLPPLTFKRNEPCWCNSGKKYKRCHGK